MDTMMILGKKFINYKEFFHTHAHTNGTFVCSCSRSVAALLLVSWLMGSWLLVYLRTVRHSWEQINTFLPFLVAFLRISS